MGFQRARHGRLRSGGIGARLAGVALCVWMMACSGPGTYRMRVDGRGQRDIDFCAVILAPADVLKGTEESGVAMQLLGRQEDFLAFREFEPTQASDGRTIWRALKDGKEIEQLEIDLSDEGLELVIAVDRELFEISPGTSLGVLVQRDDRWVCTAVTEAQMQNLKGEQRLPLEAE